MSVQRLLRIGKMTHVMTPEGGRPLSCGEKLVLYALSDEHGRYGPYSKCTQANLANWCRLSIEGVRKITHALEKDKVLVIDRPKVSRQGAPFHYVVNEAKLYWQSPAFQPQLSTSSSPNSVHPPAPTELGTLPKAPQSTLSTDEVGSSVSFPKLVEVGTSSHLVTDHTGENGKGKAKADKQAEKQKHKALLSELGGILRGVDIPFGLLTPKDILEAWQCKGERLDASLLPAVVRKIMRETLWKRIHDPAKYLVGRVKLEAHTVWLNLPPPDLRAGRAH